MSLDVGWGHSKWSIVWLIERMRWQCWPCVGSAGRLGSPCLTGRRCLDSNAVCTANNRCQCDTGYFVKNAQCGQFSLWCVFNDSSRYTLVRVTRGIIHNFFVVLCISCTGLIGPLFLAFCLLFLKSCLSHMPIFAVLSASTRITYRQWCWLSEWLIFRSCGRQMP